MSLKSILYEVIEGFIFLFIVFQVFSFVGLEEIYISYLIMALSSSPSQRTFSTVLSLISTGETGSIIFTLGLLFSLGLTLITHD